MQETARNRYDRNGRMCALLGGGRRETKYYIRDGKRWSERKSLWFGVSSDAGKTERVILVIGPKPEESDQIASIPSLFSLRRSAVRTTGTFDASNRCKVVNTAG